ncbi:mechanosensitive ion channel family protein [Aestuariivirga litoralis]|uniref:mechanosensitive ion channel family protein n=1 Tax=Aestuariivirga litoralis TaxID=2650924 RepID=UPI0018C65F75|nr:mechanosensitive ion channel domain-containing protein [Aestuariivirga litoralis]MBG1231869.1 mechanosensitive ion channel [Aestuariivirga litoralis]
MLDFPTFGELQLEINDLLTTWLGWLRTPHFYAQVIAAIVAMIAGRLISYVLVELMPVFAREPTEGRLFKLRKTLHSLRTLITPAVRIVALAFAAQICDQQFGSSWFVRLVLTGAAIILLYAVINRFVQHPMFNATARWIGIPAATIYAFGFMPLISEWMDGTAFEAGNIRISLLTVLKAVLFGGALFWLGRVSSNAGQRIIRQQKNVDVQTKELAAKSFNVLIISFAGILLLNLLGINLSVFAVFSGAVGVGLGFGLQQIASNFVSGIVILLERSLEVGDFLELDDGRSGTLKEINMRSSTLATFDGKDIMVPNTLFITNRVINWTHRDFRQRYEVNFTTAYDSDLRRVPDIVQKAVSSVKGVLNVPEGPECLLRNFGASTCEFSVRFWVESIENAMRYRSTVSFAIWEALQREGIPMQPPAAAPAPLHIVMEPTAPPPDAKPKPRKKAK